MADRHRFRADWHNYGDGIYFVTICAYNKQHLFGEIYGSAMHKSPLGNIVEQAISQIEAHRPDTEIINHIIMPNHIHLIITINTENKKHSHHNLGCLKIPRHEDPCPDFHHNTELALTIGLFKAGVTRQARKEGILTLPCWQPRFHEHIIRNQHSFDKIMSYIDTNVENWATDRFNNDGQVNVR